MTDIEYMIDVMTHYKNGGEVECEVRGKGDWEEIDPKEWNWVDYDYRKKPEAKRTRQVKMLGWFDGTALYWKEEDACEIVGWSRVPKEDKIIEVEE